MSDPTEKFDVVFHADYATVQPHFCRTWEDGVGCYGTNPRHGYTFAEACDEVAEWYEEQARQWRSREHPDCLYYTAPPHIEEEHP